MCGHRDHQKKTPTRGTSIGQGNKTFQDLLCLTPPSRTHRTRQGAFSLRSSKSDFAFSDSKRGFDPGLDRLSGKRADLHDEEAKLIPILCDGL